MIARLHALFDDRHCDTGIDRGFEQDLLEHRLIDVVGTTACHQMARGLEQLQGTEVDLLVARERARDGRLVLREGGRSSTIVS